MNSLNPMSIALIGVVCFESQAGAQATFSIDTPAAPGIISYDSDPENPAEVAGAYANATVPPNLKFWRDINPESGDYVIETAHSIDEVELMPGMEGMGTWSAELWNSDQNPWTKSPLDEMEMMRIPDHALEVRYTSGASLDWEEYYTVE